MTERTAHAWTHLSAYALAHALVDASCAALVFSAAAAGRIAPELGLLAVVVYNLLAFAIQPLLGWFVSDAATGRAWARAGALATAAAFFAGLVPGAIWPAIVVAGIANAVFHVGGGVSALRLRPGTATAVGLFVAPGAAGLAAGIWLGSHAWLPWAPAVALAALVPLLRVLPEGEPVPRAASEATRGEFPWWTLGVLLLVVGSRSLIGSGVPLPWKVDPALLVALTAAVVTGKAVGGVLADRYGRSVVGVGALVLSVPLLAVASTSAAAGIAGMLLFNVTMPITLVAVVDLMPDRPGLGFGLTCLALVTGALFVTIQVVTALEPVVTTALVLGSAGLLWLGLRSRGAWRGLLVATRVASSEEV